MDGVTFKQAGQYAMCCIENLSDELITALRDNLTRICHGADLGSRNMVIFKYEATLKSFWDRYSTKDLNTRTGMLGELLAHVIILKNSTVSMWFLHSSTWKKSTFERVSTSFSTSPLPMKYGSQR